MEVIVLPPQDCLKRAHHHHQRRLTNKPRRNPSPPSNPTTVNSTNHSSLRSNRRKPSPSGPTNSQSRSVSPPLSGQIRILKRGENLPKPVKTQAQAQPQPQPARSVLGPMVNGFYAGSACVTSPPPSELPLPAFFTRSCGLSLVADDVDNNLKIASDLRRVLKLC